MNAHALALLVALPLLGAVASYAARDLSAARRAAAAATALLLAATAALSLALWAKGWPTLDQVGPTVPGLHARWHLRLDGLTAPFLPLAAFLAAALVVGSPRRDMSRPALVAIQLSLAGAVLSYLAYDLALFAVAWALTMAPADAWLRHAPDPEGRALGRVYRRLLLASTVPLVASIALVGAARHRLGTPFPFDVDGPALSAHDQVLPFALLSLAMIIRKPLFPFHVWLPALAERSPAALTATLAGTHLGAFLVARLAIPMLPDAAHLGLTALTDVALASALYASFVGLSQRDLKRAVGYVWASQLGLVMVGLCGASEESLHGAMLQMAGSSVTLTALSLVASAVHARYGTSDVRRLGGLIHRHPVLGAAFFLLSGATIGMPGSLQFVSEDLLLHGLLHRHPFVAAALLVVTAFNGVTLLRLFFDAFYGAPRDPSILSPETRDVMPRERIVVAGVLGLVLAGGLVAQPLLDARAAAVRQLADAAAAAHEAAGAHGVSDGHSASGAPSAAPR
ncbi:MAG: proton-conducting transporter membrane subunit [Polyangiales bacterium]